MHAFKYACCCDCFVSQLSWTTAPTPRNPLLCAKSPPLCQIPSSVLVPVSVLPSAMSWHSMFVGVECGTMCRVSLGNSGLEAEFWDHVTAAYHAQYAVCNIIVSLGEVLGKFGGEALASLVYTCTMNVFMLALGPKSSSSWIKRCYNYICGSHR